MTVPGDYPDYGTPGANATAIAATGVPLLSAATPVANQVTGTLTPGQSSASGGYMVGQLGYELAFQLQAAAAGTGPDSATILLQWQDSASTITVWEKQYTILAGPNGSPHKITASGPARADKLMVTVTALAGNPDSVFYSYTVLETSRTYTRDRARTKSTGDMNILGPALGGYVVEAGNLINTSPGGVVAGSSTARVIAFWDGAVYLAAHTSNSDDSMDIAIGDATGSQVDNATVFHQVSDSDGNIGTQLYLPSLQCTISLKNLAGANATMSATLTAVAIDT